MLYLVRGNAVQLFSAFGRQEMIAATEEASHILKLDLHRTYFLGNAPQATQFINAWEQTVSGQYYTQGNMSGGILCYLLGNEPLRVQDETEEEYYKNYVRKAFAYVSDNQQTCGLMAMYRRDNPSQWMLGIIKNTTASPEDREIILLASFNLTPYLQESEFGVSVATSIAHLNDLLKKELDARIPTDLLRSAFTLDKGEINLHFDRINLVMRMACPAEKGMAIKDPLNFAELNLLLLFADNPVLDWFNQYTITPSFAMLKDCLSVESGLRKELQQIKLTGDKKIDRHLIHMTMVFYEEKTLEENRKLLADLDVITSFSALMWNKGQVKLIPFMRKKKYLKELMERILNQDSYYEAVNRLVQLGLTQDIPSLFDNPEKLLELERVMELTKFANEDCIKLCLIFWVKSSFTMNGYNRLIEQTKKYPLMASTLVALDKIGTVIGGITGLNNLAMTPRHHLKKSIAYHFFPEKKEEFLRVAGFYDLSSDQLEQASKALKLLKEAKIEDSQQYDLVINNNKSGQALRIFLPEMAAVPDSFKKVLIHLLYTGINSGTAIQGKELFEIKSKELLVLAKELCARFYSVKQLQDLLFPPKIILWTAQNTDKSIAFRQIISQVEEQCKKISNRLLSSVADKKIQAAWVQKEEKYRTALYHIAYTALKNAEEKKPYNFAETRIKLKKLEDGILEYIDPPIKSNLHKAFIIITNILITALTLALANYIKYKKTGNCWFFNQTKSGEEVRQLKEGIIASII